MLFVTWALALFLAVITVLPWVPVAHGLVRSADFPRQQALVLAVFLLLFSGAWLRESEWFWGLQALLGAVGLVQAWNVIAFTPLWPKQSKTFDPAEDHGQPLRLVAANVKMSNRRYGHFIEQIAVADPDILVLMEVDDGWLEGLAGALERYPYSALRPQDNAYGMALFSKFPLEDVSIQCLLIDRVPSIIATVVMDGQRFRLYSLHPEPPMPYTGSEGRDGETGLVALMVRKETLPVIVTGDLNDVAWSGTTRRFRKISGLLDPRIGRRIFSTFDARIPLIRWPLDHLFHSAEFRIVAMHRLKPGGSDHFPVMFDLVLCHEEKVESAPPQADRHDIERARELAGQAARRTEGPIGEDWER
jgi:endonuclease/exonuclease/phosphatase (EEP) superfamily protein YafD